MANSIVSRRVGGFNATHSPVLSRFALLRAALPALVEAERALDGYAGQDPALQMFTDAVDEARAALLSHGRALAAAPVTDPRDHALRRVAALVRTIVLSDDASEVARLRDAITKRRWAFCTPPSHEGHDHGHNEDDAPYTAPYTALVTCALDALVTYIDLPDPLDGGQDAAVVAGPASPGLTRRLASHYQAHTPMSVQFTALLRALMVFLQAEAPLQRSVAGDVLSARFGAALCEGEAAQARTHRELGTLLAMTPRRAEDRTLWDMGFFLYSLFGTEDDLERRALFDVVQANFSLFEAQGTHAVACQTRRVQSVFFQLCARLMDLEDFGGDGPDGSGAFGQVQAA